VVHYPGKRGVVWRVKYRDADGRQVQETLGAERDGWTRKKAEAELRERLVRVERKGWRRPAQLTFAEYAVRWFEEGEQRRGWKPSTASQYVSIRRRLVETFGPMPLAAIRPRHVAAYVTALSKTRGPAVVNRDVAVLHAVLRSAFREELVERNPAEAAERPKLPRFRPQILEPREVGPIARAFTDEQARVAFLVFVLTGVRRSELQRLRWRDIDLIENVLRVVDAKTESGIRAIAVTTTLAEALWQWRRKTRFHRDDELVFTSTTGRTYRADKFREAFKTARAAAGVEKPLRIHDLRHTALTNSAAAGASPIAIMTAAGHSSMSITKRYLHLAGVTFPDEAAALEKRLLSGTTLYPPEQTSPDLDESTTTSHRASRVS
jgi:integrase